eukprot:TRINITY_DN8705_c0_g1_i2.p1 TRINITY_DN8705_c0_g1~~TRINITY_DN8705_c0_g1_i2.p1  ORF type:complete len:353 (+),score=75.66 TRINITY_DN8705_c0_g1_i2:82-1059(+)
MASSPPSSQTPSSPAPPLENRSEPLLGHGIAVHGCDLGTPHAFVVEPACKENGGSAAGTVILLHGSAAVNWLGNADDEVQLGGMVDYARSFADAGYKAIVLDSYSGGRRERIRAVSGTEYRVDDVYCCLEAFESKGIAEGPIHLYGKSNGGYALAILLKRLSMDPSEREVRLISKVRSVVLQCPFLRKEEEIPGIVLASQSLGSQFPALLIQIAEDDRMLQQWGQETDVAAQAAYSVAAATDSTLKLLKTEEMVDSEHLPQQCRCKIERFLGDDKSPRVQLMAYSNIGHTFVMDDKHQEITDGSSKGVVAHATRSCAAWFDLWRN